LKKINFIYGIRPLIEAIDTGKEIDKVLIKNGLKGELLKDLFVLLKKNEIPIQYVPLEKLHGITQSNHQGIIAYTSAVTYQHIENILPNIYERGEVPLVIILDRISDVRNLKMKKSHIIQIE